MSGGATEGPYSDWSPDLERPRTCGEVCWKSPGNNIMTRFVYYLTRTPSYESIKDFIDTMLLITTLFVAFGLSSYTSMEMEWLEEADNRYTEWQKALTAKFGEPDEAQIGTPEYKLYGVQEGMNISGSLIAKGTNVVMYQMMAIMILVICLSLFLLTVEHDDPASVHSWWRINGFFVLTSFWFLLISLYHFLDLQILVLYIHYPDEVFNKGESRWSMSMTNLCSNGSRWIDQCDAGPSSYDIGTQGLIFTSYVVIIFFVAMAVLVPCSQYEKPLCKNSVCCPMSNSQVEQIKENIAQEDKARSPRGRATAKTFPTTA